MKAIQTLGLTKVYRQGPAACDSIHLSVNQGEIYGLLGPNGAGKSTLVKMLVGLVSPSAGSARVLGFPFHELALRRQTGYLPELFRYPPWLKAREVLDFHAGLLGVAQSRDERDALLARVGLDGQGPLRVRTFSKGMQQRLGLAVALVGKPALVFLDEPTSALDPIGRYEVGQLLRELKAQGTTVFLNSHLLSDVEKVCDSVALIDHGRVLYQGSLKDAIYGGVRRYRVQVDSLSQEAWSAAQISWPEAVIQWGSNGRAEIDVDVLRESLPNLVSHLVAHGARVYEVEPDHSSLEEWFLSRLGKDAR
jgi:ABC-2 type transport system ATP-binding protein